MLELQDRTGVPSLEAVYCNQVQKTVAQYTSAVTQAGKNVTSKTIKKREKPQAQLSPIAVSRQYECSGRHFTAALDVKLVRSFSVLQLLNFNAEFEV